MCYCEGRKSIKKALAFLLICIILIVPIYAEDSGDIVDSGSRVGTIEPDGPVLSNEQIIAIALQDTTLSVKQKQQILQKESLAKTLLTARATASATSSILYVTPIMQETDTWCSAATIQQTLGYMSLSYSNQSAIIRSTGEAPGLNTVLNYLNSHQTKNVYLRTIVDDQSDLDTRLGVAYAINSPIVFSMKATTQNAANKVWPYWSYGHFTNLCGKSTSNDEPYRVADPFYFKHYVSSGSSGILYRDFDQLWIVNGNLFGEDTHTIGY